MSKLRTFLVTGFIAAVFCNFAILAIPASASVVRIVGPGVRYASGARSWPMLGNRTWDDCSVAAAGDLIEAWNVEMGDAASTISTSRAIGLFRSLGGTASQGVSLDSVLDQWQSTGLSGNSIIGSALLNHENLAVTERAIYLLGGVIAEVYLTPETLQDLASGQSLTGTAPGSAAYAHALTFIGYNADYLTAVTFGHIVHISWSWWLANGVLEYGVIPHSFQVDGHGPVPGISTASLMSWLGQQGAATSDNPLA